MILATIVSVFHFVTELASLVGTSALTLGVLDVETV